MLAPPSHHSLGFSLGAGEIFLKRYHYQAQPNRDGSEMWTIDEYNAEFNDDRSVRRECVSCDKGFLLSPQKSAMMQK